MDDTTSRVPAARHAASVAALLTGLTLAPHVRADGLRDEPMLHPMDAFTAQTLRAGEVFYAQPLAPLPGWAFVGLTDRLQIELDLTPLVGGLFQAPHLPVPSTNVRWRFHDGGAGGTSFAVEAMGQLLWRTEEQESLDHLVVKRRGPGGFLHLNATHALGRAAFVHASFGASYQHSFLVTNRDRATVHAGDFVDLVSPDASLSLDVRPSRWLSLHATVSYGATFVYSDNQPRKAQLAYGLRVAPFVGLANGFLRSLRAEFAALVMYREDARELAALYLPIYPHVYWQWRL